MMGHIISILGSRDGCWYSASFFLCSCQSRTPAHWMVLPVCRVSLSFSIKPLQKPLCRHVQRRVSQAFLKLVKLAIKLSHHSYTATTSPSTRTFTMESLPQNEVQSLQHGSNSPAKVRAPLSLVPPYSSSLVLVSTPTKLSAVFKHISPLGASFYTCCSLRWTYCPPVTVTHHCPGPGSVSLHHPSGPNFGFKTLPPRGLCDSCPSSTWAPVGTLSRYHRNQNHVTFVPLAFTS